MSPPRDGDIDLSIHTESVRQAAQGVGGVSRNRCTFPVKASYCEGRFDTDDQVRAVLLSPGEWRVGLWAEGVRPDGGG